MKSDPDSRANGLAGLRVLAFVAAAMMIGGVAFCAVTGEWADGVGVGLLLFGGELLFVPAAVFAQRLSWRRGLRSRLF